MLCPDVASCIVQHSHTVSQITAALVEQALCNSPVPYASALLVTSRPVSSATAALFVLLVLCAVL